MKAYLYHAKPGPRYHFHKAEIRFFIEFFGCVFPQHPLAIVVGVVTLTIAGWAAWSGYGKQNPALTWLCLWILLTGGPVEAFRINIASRYSIYSALMLIFCYFFLLHRQQSKPASVGNGHFAELLRRHFLEVTIACSVLFYVLASFRAYHELHARRAMVISGLQHYLENPQENSPQINPALDLSFPDEEAFDLNMLHQAAEQGFYTVPSSVAIRP